MNMFDIRCFIFLAFSVLVARRSFALLTIRNDVDLSLILVDRSPFHVHSQMHKCQQTDSRVLISHSDPHQPDYAPSSN